MLTNKPPVDSRGKPPPWGTLIVCPLSLLGQWERELYDKIEPAFRPSVLVYHGPNRPKNPHLLVKYDVVITTYAILTSEYPKVLKEANGAVADPPRRRKKGPLFKCRFFRVVLDEAQAIKNRRSECFAASFEIRADRRWVLSGTPIQNSIDDMYSYVRAFSFRTPTDFVQDGTEANILLLSFLLVCALAGCFYFCTTMSSVRTRSGRCVGRTAWRPNRQQ